MLNTKALIVHGAELSTEHTKTESSTTASSISYDKNSERTIIGFDQEFPVAGKAWLDVSFQGTMNNVGSLPSLVHISCANDFEVNGWFLS